MISLVADCRFFFLYNRFGLCCFFCLSFWINNVWFPIGLFICRQFRNNHKNQTDCNLKDLQLNSCSEIHNHKQGSLIKTQNHYTHGDKQRKWFYYLPAIHLNRIGFTDCPPEWNWQKQTVNYTLFLTGQNEVFSSSNLLLFLLFFNFTLVWRLKPVFSNGFLRICRNSHLFKNPAKCKINCTRHIDFIVFNPG